MDVPISVSGRAARREVLIHTIRAVGPVTRALAQLRRGDTVLVRGPFGKPWPVAQAEGHDVVLIAGGIGLAPLRPVLYHVLAKRKRFGRDVWGVGTTAQERQQVLAALAQRGRWVTIYYGWRPNLPDEADNHLVELALAGGAAGIVTHNVRDLGRGELVFEQLRVLTPAQCLEEWQ